MAVSFLSNQDFGPLATNASSLTATTFSEFYIYIERFGCWAGKQHLFGWDEAGTLTDGPALNRLQLFTTNPDLSEAVLEYDDDDDSPYRGDLRVKIANA